MHKIGSIVFIYSKMGFDINIEMILSMCEETGKPFYYGKGFERIYELPILEVPQELQEYLVGRGPIFHAYTDHFNYENRYNVSVKEFLEDYPSWLSVQEEYPSHNYWLEEDHNKFKELLEWCEKQKVSFRVSWSY